MEKLESSSSVDESSVRAAWKAGKAVIVAHLLALERVIGERALRGLYNARIKLVEPWFLTSVNRQRWQKHLEEQDLVVRRVRVVSDGKVVSKGITTLASTENVDATEGYVVMDVWWGAAHKWYYEADVDPEEVLVSLDAPVGPRAIPYISSRVRRGRRSVTVVVGGSGSVGRACLQELLIAGVHKRSDIRATTPDPALIADLKEAFPEVEWFVLDEFSDTDSQLVLAGAHSVFLVLSHGKSVESRGRQASVVIDAAQRQKVRAFVFLSVAGAADASVPHSAPYRAIETQIEASGIPYTHVRAPLFMENLLAHSGAIRNRNVLPLALSQRGSTPWIALEDVGRFAAAVLQDPAPHANRAYTATTAESLNGSELATQFSNILRRPIRYEPAAPHVAREAYVRGGFPAFEADRYVQWFEFLATTNNTLQSTSDFQNVVGREPISLSEWLQSHREAFEVPRPCLLVVGGSGRLGQATLRHLVADLNSGLDLRATTTSEEHAVAMRKEFANVEWHVARVDDSDALARAVEDVTHVLYIGPVTVDAGQGLYSVLNAIPNDGQLQRLVVTSVPEAGRDDTPFANHFAALERVAEGSGVAHSVVRCNSLMEDLLAQSRHIQAGAYFAPGDGVTAPVAVRDAGAFLARVASQKEVQARYDLDGPDNYSAHDVARQFSSVLGKPVAFQVRPAAQLHEHEKELPSEVQSALHASYDSINGGLRRAKQPGAAVRQVLGREPLSLQQWIEENRGDFDAPANIFVHRLLQKGQHSHDSVAYRYKANGDWFPVTWRNYAGEAQAIAKALLANGLQSFETACLMGQGCPAWVTFYFGVQAVRGIPSGIYFSSATPEVEYILQHSEARFLFLADAKQLEVLRPIIANTQVRKVVVWHGEVGAADAEYAVSWDDFIAEGAALPDAELHARLNTVEEDDVAVLIYTSGTTGPPKAVQLTHRALYWTVDTFCGLARGTVESGGRVFSYLPLSHIAEQVLTNYLPLLLDCETWYCEGREHLVENLRDCKPTVFLGVPRVWEKFHSALVAKLPQGVPPSKLPEAAKRQALQALGLDQCVWAMCGAAPVSPDILRYFNDLGLQLRELYGQSEDCGPAVINTIVENKFGTVGKPFPGLEVRIADDGEVLVRGPSLFKGYYKDPEATAAALEGGWLHTGDIGSLDEDGFLTIEGRKKDIIITSGGKNITPINIENALKQHPLIGDAVVVGDGRPYLTALLALDIDVVNKEAQENGRTAEELLSSDETQRSVAQHVERVNGTLARVETIKAYRVLPSFSVEAGEITPTLKVKRAQVNKRHATVIEELYAANAGGGAISDPVEEVVETPEEAAEAIARAVPAVVVKSEREEERVVQEEVVEAAASVSAAPKVMAPPAQPTVLVVGGSGQTGRATLKALIERGAMQEVVLKATTSSASKVASLREAFPGVEWLVCDLEDRDSITTALRGVTRLMLILGNSGGPKGRQRQGHAVVEAAMASGTVEHVALLSVSAAQYKAILFAKQFREVEEALEASGLPWTFLRYPMFMDNLLGAAESVQGGALYMQLADAAFCPIAVSDVGAANATVLLHPAEHECKVYEVTGAEALTGADHARILSAAAGHDVQYVAIDGAATKQATSAFMPEWQAEGMVELMSLISSGAGAVPSQHYKEITGEEATTLAQWVQQHRDAFVRDDANTQEVEQQQQQQQQQQQEQKSEQEQQRDAAAPRAQLLESPDVSPVRGKPAANTLADDTMPDDLDDFANDPDFSNLSAQLEAFNNNTDSFVDASNDLKLPLLVVGASGTVGHHVLQALHKDDASASHTIRAVTRSVAGLHDFATRYPGVEWIVADLDDAKEVDHSLVGVHTLLVILSHGQREGDQESHARTLIEHAKKHQVRRLVWLSFIDAETGSGAFGKRAQRIEQLVQDSGIEYVIVRSGDWMDNLLKVAPQVRSGTLPLRLGIAQYSPVALEDVGRFLATVATEEQREPGKIYTLTGPAAVAGRDMASAFTEELGFPVAYESQDEQAARQMLKRHHLPAWRVDAYLELFEKQLDGDHVEVSPDFDEVMGVFQSTSIADWIQANRDAFLNATPSTNNNNNNNAAAATTTVVEAASGADAGADVAAVLEISPEHIAFGPASGSGAAEPNVVALELWKRLQAAENAEQLEEAWVEASEESCQELKRALMALGWKEDGRGKTSVALVTPLPMASGAVQRLVDFLFEKLQVSAVAALPSPLMGLFSMCEENGGDPDDVEDDGVAPDITGVAVYSDWVHTRVIAVRNGVPIPGASVYRAFGRKDVVDFLYELLRRRENEHLQQLEAQGTSKQAILAELAQLVEKNFYVSEHFDQEMEENGYTRNNGRSLGNRELAFGDWIQNLDISDPLLGEALSDYQLTIEIFYTLELFFHPHLSGSKELSLQEMVAKVIRASPAALADALSDNVVLCGFNCRFKGLANRLFKETNGIIAEDVDINQAPLNGCWKGARYFLTLPKRRGAVELSKAQFDVGLKPKDKSFV